MTVLSSDDPVRVFQQFATLDLLSGGRAEIIAGRGSWRSSGGTTASSPRSWSSTGRPRPRAATTRTG
ncbi:LLM class flavin-dependent oxidoreductase [Streptomyces sp. NPDC004838]